MEAPQRKRVGPFTVAAVEHTGPYAEIGSVYRQLFEWAQGQGVRAAGQPFTVFLAAPGEFDWNHGRFEVCLPVPAGTAASGEVRIESVPATDVLAAAVEGPYSEIPAHYAEFVAWLDYEGVTPSGPPREVYLVHPGPDGSGDPATFRTEIQFPVADE